MARYELGQVVPVVSFTIKLKYLNDKIIKSRCVRGPDEEIIAFDIKLPKCIEHVQVPVEYSDSKTDGYRFALENDEPNEFHNQFPTASYGQLSTETDYYFHYVEYKPDGSISNLTDYIDLFSYISDLLRSKWKLAKMKRDRLKGAHIAISDTQLDTHINRLKGIIRQLVDAYESMTGNKLKFSPMKFPSKTRSKIIILEGWLRISIKDPKEC